jgi:hypothetical protein
VWAIEADHPDGGPWLYGHEDVDTITATRMRLDGQREHAVLDEYGMPTEWRVAIRPEWLRDCFPPPAYGVDLRHAIEVC